MNKEIKTLEDLENHCKETTGYSMNVPPFVYIDKYFEDIEKAYGNGYRAGYKEGFDYSIGEAEQQKFYENGLNDAWEAVRKIIKLSTDMQEDIFNMRGDHFILYAHSAEEAIEKIRKYEDKRNAVDKDG